MRKFDARYRVTVYTQEETIIVEYPLTCKFNITRSTLSESTKATIHLYNLAPSTREKIFQDVFTIDPQKWKYVHVEAGYGGFLSMIFKGRILQAYSRHAGGSIDTITEIQAQALDIFDCPTSHTFKAGTSYKDIYKSLAADFPNCIVSNIGQLEGTIKTDTVFDGNALEEINKLTGGHTFIDNGLINTIMDNECIDVPVPVITESNGLLETPMRRDANLEVKMLFQPDLIIGQLLEIRSSTAPNFNGQYKVMGFTHDCLISKAQAGQRITTVNLWIGPLLPGANIALTGEQVTGSGATSKFNKVKGESVTPVTQNAPSNVREVYQYIQKTGTAPHTKVTNNIWWDEVVKSNSLSYGKPTLSALTNIYYTAQRLQQFKEKYFPGAVITITSGWRSSGYNSTLKNADPNSEHLYGNAIDFYLPGYGLNTVWNAFKGYWAGRKKLYSNYGFIHGDITTSRGVYAKDW